MILKCGTCKCGTHRDSSCMHCLHDSASAIDIRAIGRALAYAEAGRGSTAKTVSRFYNGDLDAKPPTGSRSGRWSSGNGSWSWKRFIKRAEFPLKYFAFWIVSFYMLLPRRMLRYWPMCITGRGSSMAGLPTPSWMRQLQTVTGFQWRSSVYSRPR